MEDALRERGFSLLNTCDRVLILVLMEDTLRDTKVSAKDIISSLNPCSNGRYSQSIR